MKLVTFTHNGATHIGALDREEVVDFSVAAREVPGEMVAFLEAGEEALERAGQAVASGKGRIARKDVELRSPLLRPPKILAVGLNYTDHIAEAGMDTPAHPTIFNKQSTSVTGPTDPIHIPRASNKVDYEGEFAVVIGRRCRHVPLETACEVIAGYAVTNDVSVRDWQMRVPTWTMGKSWDTHCPLGPWITTRDEIPDPHSLELRTWVNGELRQHSNTKHLLFNSFELIAHLSMAFTLEPGDVISTGTPSGVGATMRPRQYLKPGDVVKIAIEGLGEIENPCISEPSFTEYQG